MDARTGWDSRSNSRWHSQPIVDVRTRRVWAYEALVRGTAGEGAATILEMVESNAVYGFDQACRVKAVELAGKLFPADDIKLSINFMPNAVYQPDACIRATLNAARRANFRQDRLMFEFTETEKMRDTAHVRNIVGAYRRRGFTTAIDDFGAGYAGLGLLAELQPDVIKIDMAIIRNIDTSAAKRSIVAAIVKMAADLDITVVGEGVETRDELATIISLGIRLCQGYLLARPSLEALPVPCW
ncbi:EAL domain-containing protein [Sphingomonas oligophenolica]|uniref:EAL domain-containing protein n=1 Tax=Sphingomonas oligophenolica TaxID=301154 RepID=UPI0019D513FA|nr:EAL domain-containing protein [Sphingomonas oligophenolica]